MLTGHCSHCHKIWTLETRQGVCQWCSQLAVCQSSTAKPRQIKSRSNGRKRQAQTHDNGYDQLQGEWLTYYRVASRFSHKAQAQDREDLLHDIMIALANVARNNGHKPLTDVAMLRVASYECHKYWRRVKRQLTILSLNTEIDDGEGNATELIDTLASDKAIDLDAWLDARTWLLGCPKRLVVIAGKRLKGIPLDGKDRKYLCKWLKRQQKALI